MNRTLSILMVALLFATHLYCVVGHPVLKESVDATASPAMVLDLGIGDSTNPGSDDENCGHSGCLCEGALVADAFELAANQWVVRCYSIPAASFVAVFTVAPEASANSTFKVQLDRHTMRANDRRAILQSFLI